MHTTNAGSPPLSTPATLWVRVLQFGAIASFLLSLALYYHYTHLWNVVCDSAEMHYIVFLMSRGHAPYVQISDMNLPGAYLLEAAAMAVFGGGDVAWRFYEYLLMLLLGLASIAIVGRSRWPAGLLATAVFVLMHAADGPFVSTERDEISTILLACALAFLCVALRRRWPHYLLGFGFLVALVCSIKPLFLLADIILCALACVVLKRQKQSAGAYMRWALVGHLCTTAIVLCFLQHYHAFGALFYNLHTVLPTYTGMQHMQVGQLLFYLWPGRIQEPACLAVLLLLLRRCRIDWVQAATLLMAIVGAAVFIIQGKGYIYHRYIFAFFLVLWIAEIATAAMTETYSSRPIRITGTITLLALLLAMVHYTRGLQRIVRTDHYTDSRGVYDAHLALQLDDDLNQIGGHQLDGKVLCLETAGSCLNGLYRLQLDETIPNTGDMLLFFETPVPAEIMFRRRLLEEQVIHPADVIILGNEWFREDHPNERSFHKVDIWPAFRDQLQANYVAIVRRQGTLAGDTSAYKLLVRKGSAAAAMAAAHPLGPPVTEPIDSDR